MNVFALFGVPPEIQAYAMAKYSRSSQSMLESISELSAEQAEKFLNTFYFQYGHASIADLAHLVMAIEEISILAAIDVVDEPLWDGQERSTRYQDFRKTGYVVPSGLDEVANALFRETADFLFSEYEALTRDLVACLVRSVQRPESMSDAQYRRTLRARAFDVSRGLLPLATSTSLGQVVNARVVERQISRLLASRFPEVQAVGEALREACLRPPVAPAADDIRQRIREYETETSDLADLLREITTRLTPSAIAPTLVKYTSPDQYRRTVTARMTAHANQILAAEPAERSCRVALASPVAPDVEIAASLMYAADEAGHSYRQWVRTVECLGPDRRQTVIADSLVDRGRHDDPLREHRSGYAFQFDLLIDVGAYRDLHRHRRCIQLLQPLTAAHGPESAEAVFAAGLGPAADAALTAGLHLRYQAALDRARSAAATLHDTSPDAAPYLLPLATRCRALFKMDLAEAIYIGEQRTAPTGHFSYRQAAWEMAQLAAARVPSIASFVRATNPADPIDLLQR